MIEQEVLYERKLTGSYMKIAAENCSEFDERMLLSKKIRGVLPVEQYYVNNEMWYWYNISGKQSLDTYCKIRDIGIAFIEKIIISICDEIAILEWSLFDLNCLLLAPDYIFVNNLNQEIIFTVYPGGKEELSQQFRELMEYLLTKVDHGDVEAVRTAYGIYEKTLDEAYEITDVRDYIIRNRNQNNMVNQNPYDESRMKKSDPERTAGSTEKDNTTKISHKVFPKLLRILNEWKASFTDSKEHPEKGRRAGSVKTDQKAPGSEAVYAPSMKSSLYVAEDIGQTTCLTDYASYMQGNLIYVGTENMENILLPKQNATIGKSSSADIQITRNTISQFHAKITFQEQEFYLEDLNSTNGTYVNEEMLPYKEKRKLQVNDLVRFADVSYRFI